MGQHFRKLMSYTHLIALISSHPYLIRSPSPLWSVIFFFSCGIIVVQLDETEGPSLVD
jgi:hypothetical protein